MYGLGNWGAVGEHVNRGPAACAAHYERIYLASPAFPEPTPAPEMEGASNLCLKTLHSRIWLNCAHPSAFASRNPPSGAHDRARNGKVRQTRLPSPSVARPYVGLWLRASLCVWHLKAGPV